MRFAAAAATRRWFQYRNKVLNLMRTVQCSSSALSDAAFPWPLYSLRAFAAASTTTFLDVAGARRVRRGIGHCHAQRCYRKRSVHYLRRIHPKPSRLRGEDETKGNHVQTSTAYKCSRVERETRDAHNPPHYLEVCQQVRCQAARREQRLALAPIHETPAHAQTEKDTHFQNQDRYE